ncbi:LarC family nickel insertion protein [Dellaglioa sp. P0083]|uniref:LarC family nickel insertion protein n=1 Tax=Dellaglioa kimchii TaxID=3344667 RepID=UPI0038D42F48
MNTLYLDAFSGISGDMFIGALLDLGIDFEEFKKELAKINVDGYELKNEKISKSSIFGTSFDVRIHGEKDHGFIEQHHHTHDVRHLTDILKIINDSDLKDVIKEQATDVFTEIAKAEAIVHNIEISEIHFHEVGALDSIIDIIGCFIALDLLNVNKVISSTLTDGSGFIDVAHGRMPVPVPAVMQMRVGSQILIKQDIAIHTELITPTGMGIVKNIVSEFSEIPSELTIEKVGYGFGKRETGGFNALRVLLLEKKN